MSQPNHQFWSEVFRELPQHRAWVEINLDAFAHNVREIRRILAPGTQLLAVVKADAYGHGAVAIAQTALEAGATRLGVATILEGIELRQAGIQAPILLFGAAQSKTEVLAIAHWQIQPTLVSLAQAQQFSQVLVDCHHPQLSDRFPLPVHLKLDTGMSRLGTVWDQAQEFIEAVHHLPGLQIASVYSHLATADEADTAVLWQQYDRFEVVLRNLDQQQLRPPCCHLANSAATLIGQQFHYDQVRVGLALYGIYPAPHLRGIQDLTLRPVLSVKARITQVKTLAAGAGVSYGHRFVAPESMPIAVVGIGYADGVPRLLSNQLQVAVSDRWVPQIGAITMDQLMIDLRSLEGVEPGTVVTLIGETAQGALLAESWAEQMGTIPWEILCGFKHRLPRILVRDPD